MDLSVVIPSLNEGANLSEVIAELSAALEGHGLEVIVVDDGSTDETPRVMAGLASDPRIRYIRLRRNFGKSTALEVGLEAASGDVVVLMDGDGQDDPHEIPRLLQELGSGSDLVTGRRLSRHDRFVKRSTSRLFNATTRWVTGVPGRDFNSGLKAMRREVSSTLRLYGELHRYIPVLAHWTGFRTAEIDVNHRPRRHGKTKFGAARFWRGFLDLLTVRFLTRFTARPLHLFGGLGILMALAGVGLLGWMLVLWFMSIPIGNRPALLAGVLLVVVAVQLVSIGLLAELVVHGKERQDLSRYISELSPDPGNAPPKTSPEPSSETLRPDPTGRRKDP